MEWLHGALKREHIWQDDFANQMEIEVATPEAFRGYNLAKLQLLSSASHRTSSLYRGRQSTNGESEYVKTCKKRSPFLRSTPTLPRSTMEYAAYFLCDAYKAAQNLDG